MVAKQKILIVDDDNNIAELISLYLTKECYETMIVNDGEEALKVFDTFKPQLILLDLMLPGIDGYQVCREIRAKSNTPIIMLSGGYLNVTIVTPESPSPKTPRRNSFTYFSFLSRVWTAFFSAPVPRP